MKNMELITKNDKIFHFCTRKDNIPEENISYYGWSKNANMDFASYIKGYKYAAEATYGKFKNCNRAIEIQDTICYPLIFLYRHIVELYLKYAYIELKKRDNIEIQYFFSKCGHELSKIWSNIKSDIIELARRIRFKIDTEAIEHYIKVIEQEDNLSFNYRYPITKNVEIIHKESKYLDVTNLHDKMNLLFNYFDYLISNLSGQLLHLKYDDNFNKMFLKELDNTKEQIKTYIDLRMKLDSKRQSRLPNKKWLSLGDIPDDTEDILVMEHAFVNELTESQKTVLLLLYFTGGDIENEKLAAKKEERLKDVYKLIYSNINSDINFEDQSSLYKNNCFYDYMFNRKHSILFIQKTLNELGVIL